MFLEISFKAFKVAARATFFLNLKTLAFLCVRRLLSKNVRIMFEEVMLWSIYFRKSKFDEESEINQIRWFFDRGEGKEQDEYTFDMRMIYPDTMDRLLMESGFTIEEKWGNYDGDPFDETSLLQLYICSKNMEWDE